LVPAGVINAALVHPSFAVIAEDDERVRAFAGAFRDRFKPGADLLDGEEALAADLKGRNLVVFGTLGGNAWLRAFADRLPCRFSGETLRLGRQTFRGTDLRWIFAMRNPVDPDRQAIVYAAARPERLVNINAIFHGPTEWVVADGDRVLGSGNFEVRLPPDVMRRDLDELLATLAAVHPEARDGLPKAVVDAAARARRRIEEPLDRSEFAFVVNDVVLGLADAHSAVQLPSSATWLDLPVRWLTEGLVVSADTDRLRKGDDILSIEGRDEAALLRAFEGLIPAENPHWVRHRAEQAIRDLGVLRALGIAREVPVTVEIVRDGERRTVRVGEGRTPAKPRPPGPFARFEIDEESKLAIFTLDRCVADDFYRGKVQQLFDAVREAGVDTVLVDLRENSGGNSKVTDEFLRHVDVEEYASFSGEVRVSRAAIEQRGLSIEPGYYRDPPRRVSNEPAGDAAPFSGRLLVAIGPGTFSSGKWFAAVVQDNGLGRLIGEPTGSAPSSYGDILLFTLPGSAVGYSLSFKKWVRPDPERDPADSLRPDVSIPLTAEHLRAGVDPVLDFARSRRFDEDSSSGR
jgi:C-terminal processing protease CtpA/Prc